MPKRPPSGAGSTPSTPATSKQCSPAWIQTSISAPCDCTGIDAVYHCHAGVREWFAGLQELEHRHRIEITAVRPDSDGKLVAAGRLAAPPIPAVRVPSGPMERFEGGMIVAAQHFLSDRFHLR